MRDLKELQEELDVKKWYDSVKQHRDMCGEYSYCAYCNDMYADEPCAKAYLEEESKKKPAAAPSRARKTSAKTADAAAAEKPAKKSTTKKETAKKAPAKKPAAKKTKTETTAEVAAADASAKPKRTRTKKVTE